MRGGGWMEHLPCPQQSPTSLQTEGLPEGPHPGLAGDDAPYRPLGGGGGLLCEWTASQHLTASSAPRGWDMPA